MELLVTECGSAPIFELQKGSCELKVVGDDPGGDMMDNQFLQDCAGTANSPKVTEGAVENLWKHWSDFQEGYKAKRFVDPDRCLESLLICTAKLIFNVQYSKQISEPLKDKLKASIESCAEAVSDVSHRKDICKGITGLVRKPWSSKAFDELSKKGVKSVLEIPPQTADNMYNSEGWVMMEVRADYLTMLGKKAIDKVCSVLHVLVCRGHSFYKDGFPTLNGHPHNFDPFKFPPSKYLQYLEVYAILVFKKFIDVQSLSAWSPSTFFQVIDSLSAKVGKDPKENLFPSMKLWSEISEVPKFLAMTATWNALKSAEEPLERFFCKWVELNGSGLTDGEDGMEKSPFTQIIDKLDDIPSTDSMYRIALAALHLDSSDIIREKFFCVFVRALTKDFNTIHELKTNEPENAGKLRDLEKRLSNRYLKFAVFFKEFPWTVKKCLLTAFSLNPCEQLFEILFPGKLPKVEEESQLTEQLSFPEDIEIIRQVPISAAVSKTDEDLRLDPNLLGDLDIVIEHVRYHALNKWASEEDLEKLCRKLLQSKSIAAIENRNLDYLNVDYDKYKDLKPQYDPDDDGIEKNFRWGPVRKKRLTNIVNRAKKTVMNGVRLPARGRSRREEQMVNPSHSRGPDRERETMVVGKRLPNVVITNNPYWCAPEGVNYDHEVYGQGEIMMKLFRPHDQLYKEKPRDLSDERTLLADLPRRMFLSSLVKDEVSGEVGNPTTSQSDNKLSEDGVATSTEEGNKTEGITTVPTVEPFPSLGKIPPPTWTPFGEGDGFPKDTFHRNSLANAIGKIFAKTKLVDGRNPIPLRKRNVGRVGRVTANVASPDITDLPRTDAVKKEKVQKRKATAKPVGEKLHDGKKPRRTSIKRKMEEPSVLSEVNVCQDTENAADELRPETAELPVEMASEAVEQEPIPEPKAPEPEPILIGPFQIPMKNKVDEGSGASRTGAFAARNVIFGNLLGSTDKERVAQSQGCSITSSVKPTINALASSQPNQPVGFNYPNSSSYVSNKMGIPKSSGVSPFTFGAAGSSSTITSGNKTLPGMPKGNEPVLGKPVVTKTYPAKKKKLVVNWSRSYADTVPCIPVVTPSIENESFRTNYSMPDSKQELKENNEIVPPTTTALSPAAATTFVGNKDGGNEPSCTLSTIGLPEPAINSTTAESTESSKATGPITASNEPITVPITVGPLPCADLISGAKLETSQANESCNDLGYNIPGEVLPPTCVPTAPSSAATDEAGISRAEIEHVPLTTELSETRVESGPATISTVETNARSSPIIMQVPGNANVIAPKETRGKGEALVTPAESNPTTEKVTGTVNSGSTNEKLLAPKKSTTVSLLASLRQVKPFSSINPVRQETQNGNGARNNSNKNPSQGGVLIGLRGLGIMNFKPGVKESKSEKDESSSPTDSTREGKDFIESPKPPLNDQPEAIVTDKKAAPEASSSAEVNDAIMEKDCGIATDRDNDEDSKDSADDHSGSTSGPSVVVVPEVSDASLNEKQKLEQQTDSTKGGSGSSFPVSTQSENITTSQGENEVLTPTPVEIVDALVHEPEIPSISQSPVTVTSDSKDFVVPHEETSSGAETKESHDGTSNSLVIQSYSNANVAKVSDSQENDQGKSEPNAPPSSTSVAKNDNDDYEDAESFINSLINIEPNERPALFNNSDIYLVSSDQGQSPQNFEDDYRGEEIDHYSPSYQDPNLKDSTGGEEVINVQKEEDDKMLEAVSTAACHDAPTNSVPKISSPADDLITADSIHENEDSSGHASAKEASSVEDETRTSDHVCAEPIPEKETMKSVPESESVTDLEAALPPADKVKDEQDGNVKDVADVPQKSTAAQNTEEDKQFEESSKESAEMDEVVGFSQVSKHPSHHETCRDSPYSELDFDENDSNIANNRLQRVRRPSSSNSTSSSSRKAVQPSTPLSEFEKIINDRKIFKSKSKYPNEEGKLKVAPSVLRHVERYEKDLMHIIACYVSVKRLPHNELSERLKSKLQNSVKRSPRIRQKQGAVVRQIHNIIGPKSSSKKENVSESDGEGEEAQSRSPPQSQEYSPGSPEIEIIEEIEFSRPGPKSSKLGFKTGSNPPNKRSVAPGMNVGEMPKKLAKLDQQAIGRNRKDDEGSQDSFSSNRPHPEKTLREVLSIALEEKAQAEAQALAQAPPDSDDDLFVPIRKPPAQKRNCSSSKASPHSGAKKRKADSRRRSKRTSQSDDESDDPNYEPDVSDEDQEKEDDGNNMISGDIPDTYPGSLEVLSRAAEESNRKVNENLQNVCIIRDSSDEDDPVSVDEGMERNAPLVQETVAISDPGTYILGDVCLTPDRNPNGYQMQKQPDNVNKDDSDSDIEILSENIRRPAQKRRICVRPGRRVPMVQRPPSEVTQLASNSTGSPSDISSTAFQSILTEASENCILPDVNDSVQDEIMMDDSILPDLICGDVGTEDSTEPRIVETEGGDVVAILPDVPEEESFEEQATHARGEIELSNEKSSENEMESILPDIDAESFDRDAACPPPEIPVPEKEIEGCADPAEIGDVNEAALEPSSLNTIDASVGSQLNVENENRTNEVDVPDEGTEFQTQEKEEDSRALIHVEAEERAEGSHQMLDQNEIVGGSQEEDQVETEEEVEESDGEVGQVEAEKSSEELNEKVGRVEAEERMDESCEAMNQGLTEEEVQESFRQMNQVEIEESIHEESHEAICQVDAEGRINETHGGQVETEQRHQDESCETSSEFGRAPDDEFDQPGEDQSEQTQINDDDAIATERMNDVNEFNEMETHEEHFHNPQATETNGFVPNRPSCSSVVEFDDLDQQVSNETFATPAQSPDSPSEDEIWETDENQYMEHHTNAVQNDDFHVSESSQENESRNDDNQSEIDNSELVEGITDSSFAECYQNQEDIQVVEEVEAESEEPPPQSVQPEAEPNSEGMDTGSHESFERGQGVNESQDVNQAGDEEELEEPNSVVQVQPTTAPESRPDLEDMDTDEHVSLERGRGINESQDPPSFEVIGRVGEEYFFSQEPEDLGSPELPQLLPENVEFERTDYSEDESPPILSSACQ